jgi:XTP/dITP diphosphohydrolase
VFGDIKVKDVSDVKKNWESLKIINGNKSVFSGIPKSLPSINKTERILDKAISVGFEWKNSEDLVRKIREELDEFLLEVKNKKLKLMEEEFGDLFFSIINYAKMFNVDPDSALERANQKFMRRFNFMEQKLNIQKKRMNSLDLKELNSLWDKAKKNS